ncbi:hypothetical protein AB0L10_34650 [Streptomyces flaveolus]|uniref:hypothetical protein n=1 Tax=Streptomyces flaveolus TaxID=67297 RepID=UPI00343C643A
MTSQSGQASVGWNENPFPVSAVARFSPVSSDAFSIQTPAVMQAFAFVDQYLAQLDGQNWRKFPPQGNVIAIVGEYGTGKTHLSIELLRRIKAAGDGTIHAFYLDAPADNFLALYRERFFGQMNRRDVRERVAEYYADIVAEELGESPLMESAAQLLAERQASPHEIVQRFGLRESAFQQKLQERLKSITEHEEFGTALALFMRPEFEAAVWEWLAGHPADPVLQERGIHRTIDDDISALEAIGVFAFLYGRQHHRFVLIVDEFEKVLSRESRSAMDEGAVLAFKKLLEVFGQSRSLLILSGLPDFIEALPDDAKQRISSRVSPTALSFDDACKYVRNALGRETGDLTPFSDDSISYLVELAGGNARKVIRLCYHAYDASARAGTDVTRAMVREVARQQFEVSTPDDVRFDVARILDSHGWVFEQSKRLIKEKPSFVADYWLPVGEEGAGCAVLITRSILHAPEAARLAQAAKSLHRAKTNVASVLIVNGYLAEPLAEDVTAAFSRVMLYSPMRFSDDFAAAIGAFIARLEDSLSEDRLAAMESKLDQLLRQTQSVRRAVDAARESKTSVHLESAVETGMRRVFAAIGGGVDGGPIRYLTPSTAAIFHKASSDLASIQGAARAQLSARFVSHEAASPSSYERTMRQVGALAALETVVDAFREGVAQYNAMEHMESDMMRPNLDAMCSLYDRSFYQFRDLFREGMNFEDEVPSVRTRLSDRLQSLEDLAQRVWHSERERPDFRI